MDLPQRPPHTPPPRLGSSAPAQNAKSAWPPSIHHHQPTSLLAMSGAAHPPSAQAHCARSSPRELADALSRRAKDMQQQRPRACCLAPSLRQGGQHCSSAWLPQIVSAIFDTSSSYHALRERPGRLADVMCSTSSLLCDQCLLIFLEKTHSHRIAVPLAHQCDGDF